MSARDAKRGAGRVADRDTDRVARRDADRGAARGLRGLVLPYGPSGAAGVVAAILGAGLRVAVVPLFVTPVLDRVIGRGELSALPSVLAASGAAVAGMALLLWAQDALLARSGAELAAVWRERVYLALLARAPGRLPGTSGGLSGRILTDLREVEHYHQYGIGTLAAEGTSIVGILAVLFWRAPGATAALLGLGLPIALVLGGLGRRLRAQADRAQAGSEAVGAHLQEGLRQHAVARAFRAEGFLLRRFDEANVATRRAATRRGLLESVQVPVTQVFVFGALAGLVALLARQAATGAMTVGEVVEYLTLVALLSTPAQLLPRGHALMRQAQAAGARLLRLLDAGDAVGEEGAVGEPDARREEGADAGAASRIDDATRVADGARDAAGMPGLVLEDVRAGHDGGPAVLRGASATLPARGLVALVGDSGAGKSTLLAVLLGFLTPTGGRARLGDRPLDAARDRIGWVPQSLDLMRGTLRDNLALGRDLPDAALWRALTAVGMESTVRALPASLDHVLTEDGAGLSGGQRQRLLVARALLSDPAVLLLDEPTANLDPDAEAALVRTLRTEASRRLVLAVAHRAALADAADVVLRLRDGRLERVEPRAGDVAVVPGSGERA